MYLWIGLSIFVLFHIFLACGLAFSGRSADEVSAAEYAERRAKKLWDLKTIPKGEFSCEVEWPEREVSNS